MSSFPEHEVLPFTQHGSDSEEDYPQSRSHPLFNTVFPEFDRSIQRATSRSPPSSTPRRRQHKPGKLHTSTNNGSHLDLRGLDYVSNYDSHLMCPICHVPFIDPLVLNCDHTFCSSCLEEYRNGARSSESPQCPTCRAHSLDSSRKASRLIVNMCNDIKVRCPNEGCDVIIARGGVEQHACKNCPERLLVCPGSECDKIVKRKNFVPDQCIHTSEVQCECGVLIELGKGAWIEHKDRDCSLTAINCEHCGDRILATDYFADRNGHICKDTSSIRICPGSEYGCTDDIDPFNIEVHVKSCPLARLAPHLKKQSQLLQSIQDQLTLTKLRNEVIEAGLDKINTIISDHILLNITSTTTASSSRAPSEPDLDIEEIPRDHIPSNQSSLNHHHHLTDRPHRDLILPAHLRDLTPSPSTSHPASSSAQAASHNHLLALHESLRTTVSTLEHSITSLSHTVNDLEARTSMTLMNETLRLKEEIAHTNAAMFSTRAQVQWLLNRERIGAQQAAMGMGNARGRTNTSAQNQGQTPAQAQGSTTTNPTSTVTENSSSTTTTSAPGPASSSARSSFSDNNETSGYNMHFPLPSPGQGFNLAQLGTATAGPSAPGSNHASPRMRPSIRRLSGSQERVKL